MPLFGNDELNRENSMNKHTPGPWLVMNGSDIFTGLGAKNAEGTEAPSNDGWMIADCDMGGLSYDEVIANASLIAQAPRLLEALEGALPYLEEVCDCGPVGAEWKSGELMALTAECAAAIAAATGEQE